ncbi:MAG: hypothetical protein AB7N76_29640 [Planctomycetota bacterium]
MTDRTLPWPVRLLAGLTLVQGLAFAALGAATLIELLLSFDLVPGTPIGFFGALIAVALLALGGTLTATGWFLGQGSRPALLAAIVVSALQVGGWGLFGFVGGWIASLVGLGAWTVTIGAGLSAWNLGAMLYLIFSPGVREAFRR